MILVDTNIIINYLNGTDSIIEKLSELDILSTCGIVLAELLHGVRKKNDEENILYAIQDLFWIPIEEKVWKNVGLNLRILRENGLQIPFQDVVLATLCMEKNMPIATFDTHFSKIQEALPKLNLQDLNI